MLWLISLTPGQVLDFLLFCYHLAWILLPWSWFGLASLALLPWSCCLGPAALVLLCCPGFAALVLLPWFSRLGLAVGTLVPLLWRGLWCPFASFLFLCVSCVCLFLCVLHKLRLLVAWAVLYIVVFRVVPKPRGPLGGN